MQRPGYPPRSNTTHSSPTRASSVAWLVALAAWVAMPIACSSGTATTDGAGGSGSKDASSGGSDSGAGSGRKIELMPSDSLFELTSGDSFHMVVTDVPNACGYTMRSEVKGGARGIVINIIRNPFVPGTYTVNPMNKPIVQAFYTASDASCRPIFTITPFAKDGSTIVIRSIATERVEGSYALDFGGATMLTGDFQAINCSPLLRLNPTCVQ